MFCCPGFCGGQYVHGDEAYPYYNSGERKFFCGLKFFLYYLK